MEMLCGGALLLVVAAVSGEFGRLSPAQVSRSSALALAYLVVFGSLLGFTAYVWLLRAARTSVVATYAYVNPLVAVLLGWAILGEAITPRALLAGAAIVTAVALIVSVRPPAADRESASHGAPAERRPRSTEDDRARRAIIHDSGDATG
jgi:drug/metabolite transporter (DMT)-like permease